MGCRAVFFSLVLGKMVCAEGGQMSLPAHYFPAASPWWGTVMLSYKAQKEPGYDFFDPTNNTFSATVVLGGEHRMTEYIGLGWEIAGWSALGLNLADAPRVSECITSQTNGTWRKLSGAEISQMYFLIHSENTFWRMGRMSLPKSLSPWLWSDRSAGVVDIAYEGITAALSRGKDELWYGGWIRKAVNGDASTTLGGKNETGILFLSYAGRGAGHEWSTSFYYVGDSRHLRPGETKYRGYDGKEWAFWGSWSGKKVGGFRPAVQLIYIDGDHSDFKETLAAALRGTLERGRFRLVATLAGVNGGDYSLKSAGTGFGSSAFWGSSLSGEFGGNPLGTAMLLGRLDGWMRAESGGSWYAGAALADYDGEGLFHFDRVYGFRIGRYLQRGKWFSKVEYRYRNARYENGNSGERQRIRIDLGYRF